MTPTDRIVPTPEQLRGISHPVRVKLLGLLRMDGPQTSAELARATGLNTGATSYHLRQLAQHGFIEDAPGLGSGRERHWRAKHSRTQVTGPTDGPEPTASLDDRAAFQQTVVTWTTGVLQAAHDEWTELPEVWREATTVNDYLLRLTAEQGAEVVRRVNDLISELSATFSHEADPAGGGDPAGDKVGDIDGEGDGDADGQRELWEIHLLAFPVPGRIPHRDDQ